MRVIRDEAVAAIALQRREVDVFFAWQQPDIIERLRRVSHIKVLDRAASSTLNLVLNCTHKPLDDLRVRQAIMHAINRKALLEGFFRGTKYQASTVLTSAFPETPTRNSVVSGKGVS